MSKTLILQVFVSDMVGGCEIIAERLMDRVRDKVDTLVLCPPGEFSETLKKQGHRVQELSCLRRLHRERTPRSLPVQLGRFLALWVHATLRMTLVAMRHRPGIIQVNNANAGARLFGSAFLARTLFRPFCGGGKWILVNHNVQYVFRKDRTFDALCASVFHRVILVSAACRILYPSFQQGKIAVIYNGLDLGKFRFDAEARRRFRVSHGLGETTAAIGIIGRISLSKGQGLLLEAMDRLMASPRPSDFALFVIGEAMEEGKTYLAGLKDFLASRSWGGQVHFLGPRSDVHSLISGLDVVVSASSARVGESFGLTLVEAMASGRLVVAPRLGGIPEIISDGIDGFLYRPDDAANLAEKLSRVLEPHEDLESVRRAGLEKAWENFGMERMEEAYLRLYGLAPQPAMTGLKDPEAGSRTPP